MKQIVYFLALLFFALATIVTIQSCTKNGDNDEPNCENQEQHYFLSAQAKAAFPYIEHDTITLISNSGDTIHCIGSGKIPFTTSEFERYANPACGNAGITNYYEGYKVLFTDSIKKDSITLTHYLRVFFPPKFITQKQPNTLVFSFKNINFYIGDVQISDPNFQGYLGDVSINGTQYHDVTKLLKNFVDSSSSILLNKTYGIIQINLNINEKWTILK